MKGKEREAEIAKRRAYEQSMKTRAVGYKGSKAELQAMRDRGETPTVNIASSNMQHFVGKKLDPYDAKSFTRRPSTKKYRDEKSGKFKYESKLKSSDYERAKSFTPEEQVRRYGAVLKQGNIRESKLRAREIDARRETKSKSFQAPKTDSEKRAARKRGDFFVSESGKETYISQGVKEKLEQLQKDYSETPEKFEKIYKEGVIVTKKDEKIGEPRNIITGQLLTPQQEEGEVTTTSVLATGAGGNIQSNTVELEAKTTPFVEKTFGENYASQMAIGGVDSTNIITGQKTTPPLTNQLPIITSIYGDNYASQMTIGGVESTNDSTNIITGQKTTPPLTNQLPIITSTYGENYASQINSTLEREKGQKKEEKHYSFDEAKAELIRLVPNASSPNEGMIRDYQAELNNQYRFYTTEEAKAELIRLVPNTSSIPTKEGISDYQNKMNEESEKEWKLTHGFNLDTIEKDWKSDYDKVMKGKWGASANPISLLFRAAPIAVGEIAQKVGGGYVYGGQKIIEAGEKEVTNEDILEKQEKMNAIQENLDSLTPSTYTSYEDAKTLLESERSLTKWTGEKVKSGGEWIEENPLKAGIGAIAAPLLGTGGALEGAGTTVLKSFKVIPESLKVLPGLSGTGVVSTTVRLGTTAVIQSKVGSIITDATVDNSALNILERNGKTLDDYKADVIRQGTNEILEEMDKGVGWFFAEVDPSLMGERYKEALRTRIAELSLAKGYAIDEQEANELMLAGEHIRKGKSVTNLYNVLSGEIQGNVYGSVQKAKYVDKLRKGEALWNKGAKVGGNFATKIDDLGTWGRFKAGFVSRYLGGAPSEGTMQGINFFMNKGDVLLPTSITGQEVKVYGYDSRNDPAYQNKEQNLTQEEFEGLTERLGGADKKDYTKIITDYGKEMLLPGLVYKGGQGDKVNYKVNIVDNEGKQLMDDEGNPMSSELFYEQKEGTTSSSGAIVKGVTYGYTVGGILAGLYGGGEEVLSKVGRLPFSKYGTGKGKAGIKASAKDFIGKSGRQAYNIYGFLDQPELPGDLITKVIYGSAGNKVKTGGIGMQMGMNIMGEVGASPQLTEEGNYNAQAIQNAQGVNKVTSGNLQSSDSSTSISGVVDVSLQQTPQATPTVQAQGVKQTYTLPQLQQAPQKITSLEMFKESLKQNQKESQQEKQNQDEKTTETIQEKQDEDMWINEKYNTNINENVFNQDQAQNEQTTTNQQITTNIRNVPVTPFGFPFGMMPGDSRGYPKGKGGMGAWVVENPLKDLATPYFQRKGTEIPMYGAALKEDFGGMSNLKQSTGMANEMVRPRRNIQRVQQQIKPQRVQQQIKPMNIKQQIQTQPKIPPIPQRIQSKQIIPRPPRPMRKRPNINRQPQELKNSIKPISKRKINKGLR